MKKLLIFTIALGFFVAGSVTLFMHSEEIDDLDFLFEEEPAPKAKKPTDTTKPAPIEEELDFADLEAAVESDKAAIKPEPIVYPPAPVNKEPEKKEDPTVAAYKKIGESAKGFTYDNLPQPIKDNIEEYVIDPIKDHLKKNIKFTGLSFERPSKGVFKIIGNLILYNQEARGIIREMTPERGRPIYSLTIEFTKGIRLSSLAKELTIIDLNIEKLQLVFSNLKYEDAELGGVTIEKGLNLVGDVLLDGVLKPINMLTKLQILRMYGTIKKGLVGTTISGLVPGEVPLGKGTSLTKMILGVEILGKAPLNTPSPQFALRGDLGVKIPGQENPVVFTSTLLIGAEKATLSGAMDGMWKEPFGFKGFSIGKVGVSASVLYVGALDGLGIKGTIKLGDKIFNVATKGSVTDGAAFVGNMEGELSFKDIVAFANDISGAHLSADDIFKVIPNLELKEPKLQIVPVATVIIGQSYPQGITFDGGVTIFGKTTTMKIAVFKSGLKGSALLPEIEVPGVLTIKGTKDSSGKIIPPEVTFNITRPSSKIAELYAKCVISLAPAILGGATADGYIDFSAAGTDIKMKAKLFDQFMFDIELMGKMSISKPPVDLTIKASMAADGGIELLSKRLRNMIKSVLGDPKKAKKDLQNETATCLGLKGK